LPRFARPQFFRVRHDPFELLERSRLAQIFEPEFMLFADRVGPVAADNKVVEVADDQQGRIFESESILLKLPECGVQVLALPFIFPAEVAALPDVGPTLAATCLRGAALKAVEITRGIGFCRRRFAEQSAQIEKMLLRCRALLQLNGVPFSNEVIDRERARHFVCFPRKGSARSNRGSLT